MTGVEGYVESTASGFSAGAAMAAKVLGGPLPDFPRETAIGALACHVSEGEMGSFQPMNVNFGILSPSDAASGGKANKNLAIAERALEIVDRINGGGAEE